MCVDVGETSSSDCLHMTTDTDSSVSGHTVKARKPYIITKQRERWTDEEHNKFLEALKQYGRAWRRIEEHVGSKSTVQIRSHAQKFFSKVVRESSSNDPGTVKSIDIPPPRPKRRPSHPYPRKVGYLSTKKGSFVDDQLWSFIPNQSVSEQESKSPTSVLTALESDTMGATAFDALKPCLSPVSCSDRTVTVEEISSEQGSVSKLSSTSALCKDDHSTMVSDSEIQDPDTSKGVSIKTQQLTSLKLFGRTVIVSGDSEHQESFSDCNDIDMEALKHQEQEKEEGERNAFYVGISHMAYCLPSNNNLISPVNMVSLPSWWPLYGGIPFGFSRPSVVDGDHALKGNFRMDSSTSSCYNSGNGDRNCFEGVVQMEESFPPPLALKNSAFRKFKPSSSSSSRGFMPYKRCVVSNELKGCPATRAERS